MYAVSIFSFLRSISSILLAGEESRVSTNSFFSRFVGFLMGEDIVYSTVCVTDRKSTSVSTCWFGRYKVQGLPTKKGEKRAEVQPTKKLYSLKGRGKTFYGTYCFFHKGAFV